MSIEKQSHTQTKQSIQSTLLIIADFDDFINKIKECFNLNEDYILDSLGSPSHIADSLTARLNVQQRRKHARDKIDQIIAAIHAVNEAKLANNKRQELKLQVNMAVPDFDHQLLSLKDDKAKLEKYIEQLNSIEEKQSKIDKQFIKNYKDIENQLLALLKNEGYVLKESQVGIQVCRIANLFREKLSIEQRIDKKKSISSEEKKKLKNLDDFIVKELASATTTPFERLTKDQKKNLTELLHKE